MRKFTFDQPFREYQATEFLQLLLSDSAIQALWHAVRPSSWLPSSSSLPLQATKLPVPVEVSAVVFKELAVNATHLSFFDSLTRGGSPTVAVPSSKLTLRTGVVKQSGAIVKKEIEVIQGIEVADRLRDVLLQQEQSEWAEALAEGQRYTKQGWLVCTPTYTPCLDQSSSIICFGCFASAGLSRSMRIS